MRRKIGAVILGLLLCVFLPACSEEEIPLPERTVDGAEWNADWVTVGSLVGVDAPEGLRLLENLDALGETGMYYASWAMGEGTPYVNSEGNDTRLYDVQICLLLSGQETEAQALETLEDWKSMAISQYAVDETWEGIYNGQDFFVMTCAYPEGTNPYERGASAFGGYGTCAAIVEISCREGYGGDLVEMLTEFLERCHWAVQVK